MSVIPSFYQNVSFADTETFSGMPVNDLLRIGEVRRVIRPEDPDSRTKKQLEYDVYVMHRENGTAAGKMYHNCVQVNPLAGLADRSRSVLRKGKAQTGEDGTGSKVLVLCVNAEQSAAVIIGGIRDGRDSDIGLVPAGVDDFADLQYTYNGVDFRIKDDGSLTLTYGGATLPNKTLRPSVDTKAVGTAVNIDKDGNFKVSTSKQSVEINHKTGVIKILGDADVTLHAKKIHLGDASTEKAVLGDTLVSLLGKILDQITAITVAVPGGTSSPPINSAAFKAIKKTLKTALSSFVSVGK